jgi:streptogramin lyase
MTKVRRRASDINRRLVVLMLAGILAQGVLGLVMDGPDGPQRLSIAAGTTASMQGSPITEYPIPLQSAGPLSIAQGPDGSFWIAEYSAGSIARFFPSNSSLRQYAVPENHSLPAYVALDRLGRVWFSDQGGRGAIWMLDPVTSQFVKHETIAGYSNPVGIAFDAINNVWFAEDSANALGELVYPSYAAKEFAFPQAGSGPAELAIQAGLRNQIIWITESLGNRIAMFNTVNNTFTEFTPSVPYASPVGIVLDRSGNVWTAEHGGSSIVRLDPKNDNFTFFPTSVPPASAGYPNSAPATLVIDDQGRLWFVEHFSNKVGRLNPATHSIDEFQIPSTGVYSVLSAIDSQERFWFTEFSSDKIGVILGNATFPITVEAQTRSSVLAAGGSGPVSFRVTYNGASPVTAQLGVTSSFTQNGGAPPIDEVSVGLSSIQLSPGKTETLVATVSPYSSLASGSYSVGLVVQEGNVSAVGIAVIMVTPNATNAFLFQTLPDALTIVNFALLFANVYVWAIRRPPPESVAKIFRGSLAAILALLLVLLVIQLNPVTVAKCPGLPGIGSQTNGPDYVGVVFDVVEGATAIALAYFLVRGLRVAERERRMRAEKPRASD